MREIDPDERCVNCDRRTYGNRSHLCGLCEEREWDEPLPEDHEVTAS